MHGFAPSCTIAIGRPATSLYRPGMLTKGRLMTSSAAAELLELTPRQVDRLARNGEIPHVRLPNGAIRFDACDLAAWIETLKQPLDDHD